MPNGGSPHLFSRSPSRSAMPTADQISPTSNPHVVLIKTSSDHNNLGGRYTTPFHQNLSKLVLREKNISYSVYYRHNRLHYDFLDNSPPLLSQITSLQFQLRGTLVHAYVYMCWVYGWIMCGFFFLMSVRSSDLSHEWFDSYLDLIWLAGLHLSLTSSLSNY